MKIIEYNRDRNCYKDKAITHWVADNKIDFVIEIHRNGHSNPKANGFEMIKSYDEITFIDYEIMERLGRYFKTVREFKHSNIYNIKQLINNHTPYAYLELGFVTNTDDNKCFDKYVDKIRDDLVEILHGHFPVGNIGIVFGHGGGDPGSVNGDRTEENDVRKLLFPKEVLANGSHNAPSEWAKEAWEWGTNYDITDGTRPKDNITREEVVTMLHRLSRY